MSLKALFRDAVSELRQRGIPFAVAGGLAADLYRREPRLTMDVDLAILAGEGAVAKAGAVLTSIGLTAGMVRKADLEGGPHFAVKRKGTKPCMMVGRKPGEPRGEGVDLLLAEIPWVRDAVMRAQDHLVDYGFGKVPVLTVEDVVLAKLYALQAADLRAKDLDDLQSIFAAEPTLNVPYLAGGIGKLRLAIPERAVTMLPAALVRLVRDVSRSRARKKQRGRS